MSKRSEIICEWMREGSKNDMHKLAETLSERYRGKLEEHEVIELYGLFCEAYAEGYCNGRGDEDWDGYSDAMYSDLKEAGCL